ncbi:MAG: MFS transporter [Clostridiales Family XIII bacterium]|jgi:MFS family permease|nr:MFS transporter [Clostridiales Family XIII bacterium]
MKESNRTLIKIGVLCIAVQDSGLSATTPALGSIMQYFSQVNPILIQMIATIPSLLVAIVPSVYGKLTQFTQKRTLMYIAAFLFVVGGVAPAFINSNIYIILFLRVIFGLGIGLVTPMAMDLVIDFFEGQVRNTMQGFCTAATAGSGILFQLLGGYFAGIQWNYCFYAYGLSAIFFIIAFVTIPKSTKKLDSTGSAKNTAVNVKKEKLPGSIFLITAIFCGFFLMIYIGATNGAAVMLSEGIATPAQIGLAFSFLTIGLFLTSVLFGPLFKVLKYALHPIAYFISAAGLFVDFVATTFWPYVLGIFLTGLGCGLIIPTTVTKCTILAPRSRASMTIGIVFAGMGIGQFCSPYFFGLIIGEQGRAPFSVAAIGCIVLGVAILIVNLIIKAPTIVDPEEGEIVKNNN